MLINLIGHQNKILEEQGIITYIVPMKNQPIPSTEGMFNLIINHEISTLDLLNEIHKQYPVGTEVTLKKECGKIIPATIKEILEPARIQDNNAGWQLLSQFYDGIDDIFPKLWIKDWFNKHFAAPQQYPCDECDGTGEIKVFRHVEADCYQCNGSKFTHYVSYLYNNSLDFLFSLKECEIYNPTESWYKGKELKIIINPYMNMIRIGI